MDETKTQSAEPEGKPTHYGNCQVTALAADTAALEPCTQQTNRISEGDLDQRLMFGDDSMVTLTPRDLARLVYPNPCPRCGSVEGQWRGRRNTLRNGRRHRRVCKECTRWQSI